jgi:hypothetical protein
MTSERWQQIETLYHRALELEKSRRTVFLQDACAGDRGLQAEVERLLAEDGEAGSFLEEPAFEGAARELAHDRPAAHSLDDTAPDATGPWRPVRAVPDRGAPGCGGHG